MNAEENNRVLRDLKKYQAQYVAAYDTEHEPVALAIRHLEAAHSAIRQALDEIDAIAALRSVLPGAEGESKTQRVDDFEDVQTTFKLLRRIKREMPGANDLCNQMMNFLGTHWMSRMHTSSQSEPEGEKGGGT